MLIVVTERAVPAAGVWPRLRSVSADTSYWYGPVTVCVGHKSVFIDRSRQIEMFWHRGFFWPILLSPKKSKNNSTSIWNFVLNSGLGKFRHGISIGETCYQLSSRKMNAQSVINWTRRRSSVNTQFTSPTRHDNTVASLSRLCRQCESDWTIALNMFRLQIFCQRVLS